MKLLIFLLCLVFSRSFPTLGGFETVDPNTALDDPEIRSLIDAGLQRIISEGSAKQEFTSTDFSLTRINSVLKQISDENNYKINCEFSNDESQSITASFEIAYKSTSDSQQIQISYSYTVTKISLVFQVEQSFIQVSSSEVQFTSEIQDIINFGVNEAIQKSIAQGALAQLSYKISSVNSVYRQVKETALFYKCDVSLQSDEGVTADITFTVYYQPIQGVKTLTDFTCQSQDQGENTEVSVTTAIIAPEENQYTSVPNKELQEDGIVKNVLDFGCKQITQLAINEKKIPDTTLQLSAVISALSQVVGNGIFYQFNCRLTSEESTSVTVITTFTVYIDVFTGARRMTDYTYKVEGDQGNNEEDNLRNEEGGFVETPVDVVPAEEVILEDLEIEIEFVSQNENNENNQEVVTTQEEQVITSENNSGWIFEQTFPLPGEEEETIVVVPVPEEENGEQVVTIEEEVILEPIPPLEEQEIVVEPVPEEEQEIVIEPVPEEEQEIIVEPVPEEQEIEVIPVPEEQEQEIVIEPVPEEEQEIVIEPVPEEEQVVVVEEEETVTVEEENVTTEDGYTILNVNQVQSDTEASGVLQFGVQTVIKQGIRDKNIVKDQYSVSQITSAAKKSGDYGDLYKFSCQASSANGTVVTMTFIVYYQFSSGRRTLASYSYDVGTAQTETPGDNNGNDIPVISIGGDYVPVSPGDIQSDQTIQDALKYGTQQIYTAGVSDGKIPSGDFSISTITSVSKQTTVNGASYRCEVVMKNKNSVTVNAKFTISYQSSTKSYIISSYSYTVSETTATSTSNGSSGSTSTTDKDYIALSQSEIQSNSEAQSILSWAIDQVIQKGESAGKIPKSDYTVTSITSMSRKRQDNGNNYYKCTVELQDNKKVQLEIIFTASIKVSTQSRSLWSWSYHVSNIKTSTSTTTTNTNVANSGYTEVDQNEIQYNQEIQSCITYGVSQIIPGAQDYSLSKINSVSRQVVSSAFYYKFDIELTKKNKVAHLTCTVYYRPDINERDVIAYSYSTKTTSS